MVETGSLYIVATPIGNLQDITLRALETLKAVDVIYCEDTRRTRKLLQYYDIKKEVYSFHQHSNESQLATIVQQLTAGRDIAYVTDAGTPGLADPGGKLVNAYRSSVVPIPGPSSITALLSVAGFPANSFWFAGYVPTKKGRQTFIKKLLAWDDTIVVFETAPRLLKFLNQFIEFGGEKRLLTVGREITKQFEDIQFGPPNELFEHYQANPPKGEIAIAIAPQGFK